MINPVLPQVMGVLNVTPDSFYDGGYHYGLENAIKRANQMIKEGVDIIDIGGESTRPSACRISQSAEIDRVLPVIERLKRETNIPLSIDSRHPLVIKAALEQGVEIVNDVCALQEPGVLEIVASFPVKVCLMHMQGTPETMQINPVYDDVLKEVAEFLQQRIDTCISAGILRENIWIDPGFGFGKNLAHNLTLLGKLSFFKKLGYPLLVGLSRKSMFGAILNLPVERRLHASLAGAVWATLQGASIIRTHDVAATKEAITVTNAIQSYSGTVIGE